MQIPYILIAVLALLVILVILVLINREKIKQGASRGNNLPSPLAMSGMLLIIFAIIIDERAVSYSLIGLGVTLSVVDLVINKRKTKS